MFKKSVQSLIYLTVSLCFLSCGDISDEPSQTTLTTEKLTIECKTEVLETAFEDFFVRNLDSEQIPRSQRPITCLESTLKIFMDIVAAERPGYLSLNNLTQYIQNNEPDKKDLLDTLKLVFDIAHLIYGDDPGFLKAENVQKFIDFLRILNTRAVQVYPLFSANTDILYGNYQQQKDIVIEAMADITQNLKANFNYSAQRVNPLDLRYTLSQFFKESPEAYKKLEAFLFIKRTLLGGQIFEITHQEFAALIEKLPSIMSTAFGLLKLPNVFFAENFNQQLALYQEVGNVAKTAKGLLHFKASQNVTLFNMNTIFNALKVLEEDLFDLLGFSGIHTYQKEIQEIKDIIFGAGFDITPKQMHYFFDHAIEVSNIGKTFATQYHKYRDLLNSAQPITINFQQNSSDPYFQKFVRIVESRYLNGTYGSYLSGYRYYRGRFKIPIFDENFYRNITGVIEVGLIEYALEKVIRHFEEKYPCDDTSIFRPDQLCTHPLTSQTVYVPEDYNATITQDQIHLIINLFAKLLIEQKILLKGREANTAENITLMATHFMNQSRGGQYGGLMHVSELTEFAIIIFTAITGANEISDKLIAPPYNCFLDGNERIDTQCFRKNIFKVLSEDIILGGSSHALTRVNFSQNLKRLTQFTNSGLSQNQLENFVLRIEQYTRTCTYYGMTNAPDFTRPVNLNNGDILAVLSGFMFVESILMRWDTNKNNKLDNNEIDLIYELHFKRTIEALVGDIIDFDTSFIIKDEKLAEYFFKFLVSSGELDIENIFSFLMTKFVPFIAKLELGIADYSADRVRIAEILKVIGDNSKAAKLNPFDCDRIDD